MSVFPVPFPVFSASFPVLGNNYLSPIGRVSLEAGVLCPCQVREGLRFTYRAGLPCQWQAKRKEEQANPAFTPFITFPSLLLFYSHPFCSVSRLTWICAAILKGPLAIPTKSPNLLWEIQIVLQQLFNSSSPRARIFKPSLEILSFNK